MRAIVDIVVDASESMSGAWAEGHSRAAAGAHILANVVVPALDANSMVGLRVFNGAIGVIQLLPLAVYDKSKILDSLSRLPTPDGATPLCEAIEQSVTELEKYPQHLRQIILISDGEENCGGDLFGVLQRLNKASIDGLLTVLPIGLAEENPTHKSQMDALAHATKSLSITVTSPAAAEKLRKGLSDLVAGSKNTSREKWLRGAHAGLLTIFFVVTCYVVVTGAPELNDMRRWLTQRPDVAPHVPPPRDGSESDELLTLRKALADRDLLIGRQKVLIDDMLADSKRRQEKGR